MEALKVSEHGKGLLEAFALAVGRYNWEGASAGECKDDIDACIAFVAALESVAAAARSVHARLTSGECGEYLLRDSLAAMDAIRGAP